MEETRRCKMCGNGFCVPTKSERKYCSIKCSAEYNGKNNPNWGMRGKRHSVQTREKLRTKANLNWANEDYRAATLDAMRKANTEEVITKRGEAIKQTYITHPEKRSERSLAQKRRFADPEQRKQNSESKKKKWRNQDYREKCLKRLRNADNVKLRFRRRTMSTPEKAFKELLEANNFPFFFNGTAQGKKTIVINGKIPDFVHFSEAKIIEVYGNFHHANPKRFAPDFVIKGEKAQEIWDKDARRARMMEQKGFQVLIIWESDLKDEEAVLGKVANFCQRN